MADMDSPPIMIFGRIDDLAVVAHALRELAPNVEIDGPDDDWETAVLQLEGATLQFNFDPDYHAEPNWSTQMSGMRGYFSQFPETDRKERVMMLTTCLSLGIAAVAEPGFNWDGDPRLQVVSAIATVVDGVMFLPGCLLDAEGRVLFGAGGEDEEDPEAEWPRVAAQVSVEEPFGAALHEISQQRQVDPVDDDDRAAEPPTAARVARRAMALGAVTLRGILERDADQPQAADTYRDMTDWLYGLDINVELEPDEWAIIQRPLGNLEQQLMINSVWRLEGLVVLAWSLGLFEIPPHDELAAPNPLWQSLFAFDVDGAKALLDGASLRPREEIREQRDRFFAVHWRLRNYHLTPKTMDFVEFARTAWFGPLDVSGLPIVEGDLAVQGERLDRADEEAMALSHSASKERHQAANWLWEGPLLYSEASVAT